MKITLENITDLKPGEIFVFGSNTGGIHGAGAARLAHVKWGAKWGKGEGLHGQTYALPTVEAAGTLRKMSLSQIGIHVGRFLEFANSHPGLEFLVTAVGCGLAGYSAEEIAPLFFFRGVPSNVSLPASFWAINSKKPLSL